MAHRAIHRTGSTRSVVAELCPGRVATENLVALRVVARRLRLRRHIDKAEAAVRKNGVGGAPAGRRGRVCLSWNAAVLLALRNNIVAHRLGTRLCSRAAFRHCARHRSARVRWVVHRQWADTVRG